MVSTLGLQPHLDENAGFEVAQTFAVPLLCHFLATTGREFHNSQMARRQSQSSVKMFGANASTISMRFRVTTDRRYLRSEAYLIAEKPTIAGQNRMEQMKSLSEIYLTIISRCTHASIEAARQTLDIYLFCLPWGIRLVSRTGHWTSLKLVHLKENSIIFLPREGKCLIRKWR